MHWSHKYKRSLRAKKLGLSSREKFSNSHLIGCYDKVNLLLGVRKKRYIRALRNKAKLAYQSRLMQQYFTEPEKYLELDCDRLTATFDITENDVTAMLNKITKFPHQVYEEVISIKRVPVASINNKKKYVDEQGVLENNRPFYTHCYRLEVFNNRRKFFIIHIADGLHSKSSKLGFRIDFIPDRFTAFELRLIFSHIRSVLSTKRYEQLVKHANVTRVDIGINFYGLMSPFVHAFNHANRKRSRDKYSSATFPKGRFITETVYYNSKRNSSHFVLYEKLLKELKDDAEHLEFVNLDKLLPKLLLTTRLERRYYPYREHCGACRERRKKVKRKKVKRQKTKGCARHQKCEACEQCIKCGPRYKKLTLASLSDFPDRFSDLTFIDPHVLSLLNKDELSKLLKHKSHHNVIKLIVDRHPSAIKKGSYRLDKNWVQRSKQKLLNNLSDIILWPTKKRDDSSTLKSYKISVHAIKAYVEKVKTVQLEQLYATPVLHELDARYQAQEKAANANINQNIMVIAGAGSGKTKAIVKRFKFLVKGGVPTSDIQILAYNKDAVNELSKRISAPGISTFHAWCKRHLEAYYNDFKHKRILAYRDDLGEKDESRDEYIATSEEYLTVLNTVGIRPKLAKQFLTLCSYKINSGATFAEAVKFRNSRDFDAQALEHYFKAYKEEKEKRNYWDFDDMFSAMLLYLQNDPSFLASVRRNLNFLLVDEVQDSSVVQLKILKLLSQSGVKLYLVGDPAQAIYGFRGVDVNQFDLIHQAESDFNVFELDRNYRSVPGILNLGNWFRRQINPTYKMLEGIRPEHKSKEKATQVKEFSDHEDLYNFIEADVGSKIADGVQQEHIMILCRTNNLVTKIKNRLKSVLGHKLHKNMVTTIHKTKGLGCNVVYLIDPRFGNAPFDNESEHHRLLYVAITRAKEKLILCKSIDGKVPHISPSNTYILDRIPSSMLEVIRNN